MINIFRYFFPLNECFCLWLFDERYSFIKFDLDLEYEDLMFYDLLFFVLKPKMKYWDAINIHKITDLIIDNAIHHVFTKNKEKF